MDLFEFQPQAIEQASRGFDDQQTLVGFSDGPFPSIEAAHPGQHVDAGRQPGLYQIARNLPRLLQRRASAENDNFIGHVKNVGVLCGSDVTMWSRYYLTMKNPAIRIAYMLALMMAVAYAVLTMRGPHGISAWMEKRQQIRDLEENNAILMKENQVRREYIDRL